MPVKTHYDTLKVTQDAPDEVIAAAYKALALKYHPDKTGNSPEAMAVMQEINISYKILSDPHKRAEHDRWLAAQQRSRHDPSAAVGKAPAGQDKSMAEAGKWKAWADKTAQEAKEAQTRADKALADLAKANAADRAKWEIWAEKMTREASDAKDRAEKAAAQSEEFMTKALDARARLHETTGK